MNTIRDFKNQLLHRREVKVVISASSNPGFAQAFKLIVENFKVSEENIAVKNVKGKFGRNTFLVDAFIYDSVKDKEMTEPKPKVKKVAGTETAVGGK